MLTYSDNLKTWSATLRQYAAFSKLDWKDICNKKALDLAFKCIQYTQTASPMAIKAIPFEQRGWYGQVVKWMKEHGGLEQRVEIKRGRGRKGGLASFRYRVGLASRRMIGSRLSAVGFVKSGWIAALGQLLAISGIEGRRKSYGVKIFGNPKGYAVAARGESFSPFAIIANTSASYASDHAAGVNATHSSGGASGANRVHEIIQKGAMQALSASDADMRKYIEKKISERIKYFTGY